MTRLTVSITMWAFVFPLMLAGCNAKQSDVTQPAAGQSTSPGQKPAAQDSAGSDTESVKAELAKLSPEDAKSAESQHACPVSGELLGTMGPPKKVDLNGKQVWICCDGCRKELESNSEKYLAKLKKE